ncbi:MAG TPA: hypothetical protein VMP89_13535 [Solirubrobacteraceae bacterium]|nr:hypothetical protein [Solirubrobacteraceae bacterium]
MSSPPTVTIRPAYPDDEAAIRRLAALDSAAVPPAPFLLAEVDGEILAAASLGSGRVVADPFHPTLQLVAMLRAYAAGGAPEGRPQRGERRYRSGRLALGY